MRGDRGLLRSCQAVSHLAEQLRIASHSFRRHDCNSLTHRCKHATMHGSPARKQRPSWVVHHDNCFVHLATSRQCDAGLQQRSNNNHVTASTCISYTTLCQHANARQRWHANGLAERMIANQKAQVLAAATKGTCHRMLYQRQMRNDAKTSTHTYVRNPPPNQPKKPSPPPPSDLTDARQPSPAQRQRSTRRESSGQTVDQASCIALLRLIPLNIDYVCQYAAQRRGRGMHTWCVPHAGWRACRISAYSGICEPSSSDEDDGILRRLQGRLQET